MYLVSLYFDEVSNRKIHRYMQSVASASKNMYVVEHKIPPHITVSAFDLSDTVDEDSVRKQISEAVKELKQKEVLCSGQIDWVSIGAFKQSTLFIQPVLNECLHSISKEIYNKISILPDIRISHYYRPFQWIAHASIAKHLSKEEMVPAFIALQNSFEIFQGQIVRIELAKKHPFQVIETWDLHV